MPTSRRIRPYKDFLTPAMHRRFIRAASTLFLLCYAEALLIGGWDSFIWLWFVAAIRACALFIASFVIYLLRVGQLHVGDRTSYFAWEVFGRFCHRFDVVLTVGFYASSAVMFGEIYNWSVDLKRIVIIPKTDRPMLNERTIYLTSHFLIQAVVQAAVHIIYDYDKIEIPIPKTSPEATADQRSNLELPAAEQLSLKLPTLAANSLRRAVLVAMASPFLYSMPLPFLPSMRQVLWTLNRSWAKILWNIPKSAALPSNGPFHWATLLRSVWSGFLLVLLWEVGNAALSSYTAQEPLKKGRPITYESRDPNGSLLTGLNAKKLQTKSFAFWELLYIAQRLEGRRKNIFEDIDRDQGSSWSHILNVCLSTVNKIDSRIVEYKKISSSTPGGSAKEEGPHITGPAFTSSSVTPFRVGDGVKNGVNTPGDIFNLPTGERSRLGEFAKKYGQSPPSPRSKKLLLEAEARLLSEQQREALSKQGMAGLFREWFVTFLNTPIGWPWRQEYRRRMAVIILGGPYGDLGIIVDSIDALTQFAVHSLAEDKFGNVQRDVKTIIETFTKTVLVLEDFKVTLGVHWTDVQPSFESPEADTILAALKRGLNELVVAFGDYSQDLKLSQSELRKARDAAASPLAHPRLPDMQQIR